MGSIRITARQDRGIRRVGVFHPAEPTVYPENYFDRGEIEVLRQDRDLIVEMLDEEFITPAERRHLQLLGNGTATHSERARSDDAQPDAGHAPSSTLSHEQSAEQQAAEGEGAEQDDKQRPAELPELPPVAKLEDFLAQTDDRAMILAMQLVDTRITAAPIYAARIAYMDELRALDDGR